jgi:endoglycosylceramidase
MHDLSPALRAACTGGLVLMLLASCQRPAPALTDEQGRTLLLHGVNLSDYAKRAEGRTSWHTFEDYARLRGWGLHAVRLLVFWDALQPEPGQIDEAYLDRVQERVGWARQLGLLVILDLHQDIYSTKYTGDGAPHWACLDEGESFEPVDPWWMRNLQPAVRTAWNNFWETDALQDHYAEAFARLASRFVGEAAVLGYDLMNEPFGFYPPAEFEVEHLRRFYEKLGRRLVQVDPDKLIFYEPLAPLNPGLPSQVGGLDGLPAAYFPHFYHVKVHEGLPYDGNDSPMRWAVDMRQREAAQWQRPLLFGEIGVIAGVDGAEQYMRDLVDLLDRRRLGWFYWSYDRGSASGFNLLDPEGNEYPVLDVLIRTHPLRTAGELIRFGTDPTSGAFEMLFLQSEGVSGPSEIVVPRRRFPQGFLVDSTDPPGTWSWSYDPQRQILTLVADPGTEAHTLRIVPGP